MTPASPGATSALAPPSPWRRFPAAPLGLTAVLLALTLTPRVREHEALRLAFFVAAAVLVGWSLLLMLGPARRRGFAVDFATPQKSHYIQASVQILIYVYWGFYWDEVWKSIPLFLAQFAFLYAFDALLSWSRGRAWRLGFGPLPIVLSTNIFLWFKDDWYVLQFALIAVGALGKEFLRWKRNGKSVHVFNPSAFPLFVASIVLLTTGLTDISWARDIATTVSRPPYIYVEIFLLGLVVQYFFSVTLVTLSAVGTLVALNFAFTRITGVYLFIDVNVPVPSFIGLHFLVTDPATSPRSNAGRVLFGASYGALVFVIAGVFGHFGLPTLYDKLLPIPMLNLCVPWMDRLAASGFVARLTRWEQRLQPRRLNLACMGIWIALFTLMLSTGYIEAPHPGDSIKFWKQAVLEGKPMARRGLLTMLDVKKRSGDADVWNEMGLMYHDGKLVKQDEKVAMYCFTQGARLGSSLASLNLVTQHIFLGAAVDQNDLLIALRHLEEDCATSTTGQSCFVLGAASETGRGRPQDLSKAREYYKQACTRGYPEACKRLDLLNKQAPPPDTPPH